MNWKSAMSFSSLSISNVALRRARFVSLAAALSVAVVGVGSCVDSGEDAGSNEPEPPDAGQPDPTDAGPEPTDAGQPDAGTDGGISELGDLLVDVLGVEGTPVLEGTMSVGGRIEPIVAGQVLLAGFPEGTLRGIVRAPGYAPANVFGSVVGGRVLRSQVFLMPVGASVEFAGDEDANLRFANIGVEVAANSFVDSAGSAVTGTITAHLTAFDPALHMRAAPGPFQGLEISGAMEMIETFGMGEFTFEVDGAPVNLASGTTATVEVMLAPDGAGLNNGDQIPSWSYDLESGHWVEEALGIVRGFGERLVWRADVEHFSWWNADQAVTQKECLNVQILAAENVGVVVYTEGVDYNGINFSRTDSFGEACVEFKAGSTAQFFAGGGTAGFSYALDLQGTGEDPAACGNGSSAAGCATVIIDLPPRNCVSGVVTQSGSPVDGARVVVSWGTNDASLSYTNPDGSFCSSAPVGTAVSVFASFVDGTGSYLTATRNAQSLTDPGQCGVVPSTCASAGSLELVVPPQYCLEGITESRVNATTVDFVPTGTPVYAFRSLGFTEVDCAVQPASWGSIIARGTVGGGGRYCLNLPFGEDTRDVVFAVDSCDVGSCETDLPQGLCFDSAAYSLAPGDDLTARGGTCQTSGCLPNDILFE